MNNFAPLTWKSFKSRLLENHDKMLQFQYAEGQFVDQSYHITEIKHAPVTSVDCGGVMNRWTEVIVQLYEPSGSGKDQPMKTDKAISIINTVERMLPLDADAIVKIEFGNSKFDTRQMYPGDVLIGEDTVTVNLTPDFTQCKAATRNLDRGETGSDKTSSCCSTDVVCC